MNTKMVNLAKYKEQLLQHLHLADRRVYFFDTHFDALQQVYLYTIANLCLQTGKTQIAMFGSELSSVFHTLQPFEMTTVAMVANNKGLIDASSLDESLNVRSSLVSIELIDANFNQQDLHLIGRVCQEKNVWLHVDITRAIGLVDKIDGLDNADFVTCADNGGWVITKPEISFTAFREEGRGKDLALIKKMEKATSHFMDLAMKKEQILQTQVGAFSMVDFPNLPTHIAIFSPKFHGKMVRDELMSRGFACQTLANHNVKMEPLQKHGLVMIDVNNVNPVDLANELKQVAKNLEKFTKQLSIKQGAVK